MDQPEKCNLDNMGQEGKKKNSTPEGVIGEFYRKKSGNSMPPKELTVEKNPRGIGDDRKIINVPQTTEIDPLLTLSKEQVRAAQYLSLGFAPRVVAGKVGRTASTVNKWRKFPKFQEAVTFFQGGGADRLMEELRDMTTAGEIIEKGATRAAEKVMELMEDAEKDETQLRAAEGILDRAGHARKSEVQKTVVLIEASALTLIERERQNIREAEYELIEGDEENVEEDKSGNSDGDGPPRYTGGREVNHQQAGDSSPGDSNLSPVDNDQGGS